MSSLFVVNQRSCLLLVFKKAQAQHKAEQARYLVSVDLSLSGMAR
jgi:hypothetical protein